MRPNKNLQDLLRETNTILKVDSPYDILKRKYATTLQLLIDLKKESNNEIAIYRTPLYTHLNQRRILQAHELEKLMDDREFKKRQSDEKI